MHWKICWNLHPSHLADLKIVHFHGPKPGSGVEDMAQCNLDAMEQTPERYHEMYKQSVCCDHGKTANTILHLYQYINPGDPKILKPFVVAPHSSKNSNGLFCLQNKINEPTQTNNNAISPTNQQSTHVVKRKPIVSFVIPSKLDRAALERTLQSLLRQTNENWECIVGIDMTSLGNKSETELLAAANGFPPDPRIHYQVVHVKEKFRGRKINGSGLVRNQIILDFATSDWVAFVDDDDTLSPYYVEMLAESLANNKNSYDIVLFRMQGFPEPRSMLPPKHLQELGIGDFGISFAVRRSLYQDKGILFVPHPSEDYFYVKNAVEQRCSTWPLKLQSLLYSTRFRCF